MTESTTISTLGAILGLVGFVLGTATVLKLVGKGLLAQWKETLKEII